MAFDDYRSISSKMIKSLASDRWDRVESDVICDMQMKHSLYDRIVYDKVESIS